jgi:hypothetical protein
MTEGLAWALTVPGYSSTSRSPLVSTGPGLPISGRLKHAATVVGTQPFVVTSLAHRKEQRMSCLLHLVLLAGVAFVAYHIGKKIGYEEAVPQKRGSRYRHG